MGVFGATIAEVSPDLLRAVPGLQSEEKAAFLVNNILSDCQPSAVVQSANGILEVSGSWEAVARANTLLEVWLATTKCLSLQPDLPNFQYEKSEISADNTRELLSSDSQVNTHSDSHVNRFDDIDVSVASVGVANAVKYPKHEAEKSESNQYIILNEILQCKAQKKKTRSKSIDTCIHIAIDGDGFGHSPVAAATDPLQPLQASLSSQLVDNSDRNNHDDECCQHLKAEDQKKLKSSGKLPPDVDGLDSEQSSLNTGSVTSGTQILGDHTDEVSVNSSNSNIVKLAEGAQTINIITDQQEDQQNSVKVSPTVLQDSGSRLKTRLQDSALKELAKESQPHFAKEASANTVTEEINIDGRKKIKEKETKEVRNGTREKRGRKKQEVKGALLENSHAEKLEKLASSHMSHGSTYRAELHDLYSSFTEKKGNEYFCRQCSFSSCTWRNIKFHIRRKHVEPVIKKHRDDHDVVASSHNQLDSSPEPALSDKALDLLSKVLPTNYPCTDCEYVGMSREAFYRHKLKYHRDHKYICSVCGKTFSTTKDFKQHQAYHTDRFSCEICHKVLRSKQAMNYHRQVVHEGRTEMRLAKKRNMLCNICGRAFNSKRDFDVHVNREHKHVRPYACRECGKSFYSKTTLSQHQVSHSQEEKYHCENCGKRFRWYHCYRTHRLTHTNERPYVCTECKATFTQRSSLKRHERIHTGEKPFLCQLCPKRFADSSVLRRHLAGIHYVHGDTEQSSAKSSSGKHQSVTNKMGPQGETVSSSSEPGMVKTEPVESNMSKQVSYSGTSDGELTLMVPVYPIMTDTDLLHSEYDLHALSQSAEVSTAIQNAGPDDNIIVVLK